MTCPRNRIFDSFGLAIALVCLAPGARAQADCTLAGTGTAQSPYSVATYGNLEQVGTSCDLGATYRLVSDIDASPSKLLPQGFTPIGHGCFTKRNYTSFSGAFHGAGHRILNLYINDSADEAVGLFGYVVGATIDSLGLVDAQITGTVKGAAPSSITGRPSIGKVDTLQNQCVTGGIAGLTDVRTTMDVVLVTGSVKGSPAGGIVGTNGGITRNAYAACRVTSHGYAGGIVGSNEGDVNASYATNLVSGGDTVVGGSITYGGGIGGVDEGTAENVYWNVATTGRTGAFGVEFGATTASAGLTAQQSKDSASYPGFGFGRDSAWSILQGQASPVLRVFAAAISAIHPETSRTSTVRLRHAGALTEIVLPGSARVGVVDGSGRQVLAETEFSAGAHALALHASPAMLFVQVRSGISTITLPLAPVR